jgi:hypothetical protein
VQHALTMNIVELEALNERAIDQRGMRCGQAFRRSPHAAGFCGVEPGKRCQQDPDPFEHDSVKRASKRIKRK